jgi:hypothetical protein
MKKFIYLGLLLLGARVMAQDYAAYELPEYTAVADDSTDVLYIDDSGVDKHIEMPTFLGVIHDTADVLRSEMGTGSGIVDTTGLPVADQVAYWTSATHLGGDAGFTFDGSVITFSDSISVNGVTRYHYFNLASTDTVALLLKGSAEVLDTASLVPAAKAWVDSQKPFKLFFWKAKKNQALPLPYPNGSERREINAMYAYYQIEYELERANRYINRMWNWMFIMTVVFVGYIIYNHEK